MGSVNIIVIAVLMVVDKYDFQTVMMTMQHTEITIPINTNDPLSGLARDLIARNPFATRSKLNEMAVNGIERPIPTATVNSK